MRCAPLQEQLKFLWNSGFLAKSGWYHRGTFFNNYTHFCLSQLGRVYAWHPVTGAGILLDILQSTRMQDSSPQVIWPNMKVAASRQRNTALEKSPIDFRFYHWNDRQESKSQAHILVCEPKHRLLLEGASGSRTPGSSRKSL